jgi:hypothetical protein
MTKTTNFEISKKLAEIGFKKETDYFFYLTKPDWFNKAWSWQYVWHYATEGWVDANNDSNFLPSYDLEVLLEALPEEINLEGYCQELLITKNLLAYRRATGAWDFEQIRNENESLADTAGRLIILLESNNLIKF